MLTFLANGIIYFFGVLWLWLWLLLTRSPKIVDHLSQQIEASLEKFKNNWLRQIKVWLRALVRDPKQFFRSRDICECSSCGYKGFFLRLEKGMSTQLLDVQIVRAVLGTKTSFFFKKMHLALMQIISIFSDLQPYNE